MPILGSTARFTDAEAFAASVHNITASFVFTGRGSFQARTALARLDELHLGLMTETLARRVMLSYAPDRLFFRLVAAQDRPKIRDGVEDQPGTINIGPGRAEVEDATTGPAISRSLSLPMAAMIDRAHILFDAQPSFLYGRSAPLRPPPAMLARLVVLHRDTVRAATSLPDTEIARQRIAAMKAAIGDTLTEILAADDTERPTRQQKRGQATMRTLTDYISAHEDRPITLTELCVVAGCSAKSIETLFLRNVGETPNRYLRRWRMWRAREALGAADPATTTVSTIALANGFWELGRFAVSYRKLFGESPSETLRQPPRAAADLSRRPSTKTA